MSKKIITVLVSRVDNSYKLQLSDSEGHSGIDDTMETDINTGDQIIWKLAENSGLDGLHGVRLVKTPNNVMLVNSKNGEILAYCNETKAIVKDYEIGYFVDGEKTPRWEDPKLKMNF